MIEEGQAFPAFKLPDQNGQIHNSEDLKGKPYVVYFYPKDDTSGCTKEACEFRDSIPHFEGEAVFGVSPDSVASHKKFATKFNLDFPLLADVDRVLIEAVGVWAEKSMYGRKYMGVDRTTFLVDSNGKVAKIWRKVKPEGHAAEVLAAVQQL